MSKKIYKGYELIKAIADGKIKDETKFKIKGLANVYKYEFGTFISEETGEELDDILSTEGIARAVFELIEDEIDINNIKELYINDKTKTIGEDEIKFWTGRNLDIVLGNRINALINWAKQADKEIKSIKKKECCQVCGVELTEENKALPNMCNECKYGEE